jgi:hypothetical protein
MPGKGDLKTMAVYAGFEHPQWHIGEALLTGGGAADAAPLNEIHTPPMTGVRAFAMNPAFAYSLVHERLRTVAQVAGLKAFESGSLNAKRFTERSPLGIPVLFPAVRSPSGAWTPNAKCEDLTWELHGRSLATHGCVLLPCFVCEYTHAGEAYRCFVSGVNGQVHRNPMPHEHAHSLARSARTQRATATPPVILSSAHGAYARVRVMFAGACSGVCVGVHGDRSLV